MTNGKKLIIAAGFVGYSYLLFKSSFLTGRIRGWLDAADLAVSVMTAHKENEEKSSKTEESE